MDYYALLFFRYLKSKGSKGLRMIYNAFKGGTEQLLPVNTDTPSTSPLIADIKYTDALRENQEFTYRECPITEDGKAKLKSIKGNTIVWNQLSQIRATASQNGITFTNNNDGTYTVSGTATAIAYFVLTSNLVVGHKYFISINGSTNVYIIQIGFPATTTNTSKIITAGSASAIGLRVLAEATVNSETVTPQVFDLTAMFGSDKADEIYAMETAQAGSGVAYFRSLFPLPYYQYDAGSLLSFNGTGIKTTGKNVLSLTPYISQYNATVGNVLTLNDATSSTTISGDEISFDTTGWGNRAFVSEPLFDGEYFFSSQIESLTSSRSSVYVIDQNNVVLKTNNYSDTSFQTLSRTVERGQRIVICIGTNSAQTVKAKKLQIEKGSVATEFEPYTSSTTSIPTSTYFPTGMKSAGSVYDELTNSKAITRIGEVDLGSLRWFAEHNIAPGQFRSANIGTTGISMPAYNTNFICSKYENGGIAPFSAVVDKTIAYTNGSASNPSTNIIRIHDSSCASMNATEFKASLNGVMLQYELAEESSVDVDQSDTNQLLNSALSTIMGRNVTSNNPQLALDVLTKGE